MKNENVKLAYKGECKEEEPEEPEEPEPKPCACPEIYSPVCGRDGKTYSNSCQCRCKNVHIRHPGRCRPIHHWPPHHLPPYHFPLPPYHHPHPYPRPHPRPHPYPHPKPNPKTCA